MRFAEADGGGYRIEAYGREGIRVAGRTLTSGLILTPERLIEGWGPADAATLDAGHLQPLIDLNPELIVIGTGAAQVFPDPALYVPVLERRIGLEIMDTGAACRTYNILMAEGRRVAAALLPLSSMPPTKT
ncbi:MAG: Mth938-like domain-containing protein [Bdellovibrio bacteriovorus]